VAAWMITQALNDLGWLAFVMNWPAATIQCLAIGFAIFGARDRGPIWPRPRLVAVVAAHPLTEGLLRERERGKETERAG
jgi:hypothetical protein